MKYFPQTGILVDSVCPSIFLLLFFFYFIFFCAVADGFHAALVRSFVVLCVFPLERKMKYFCQTGILVDFYSRSVCALPLVQNSHFS